MKITNICLQMFALMANVSNGGNPLLPFVESSRLSNIDVCQSDTILLEYMATFNAMSPNLHIILPMRPVAMFRYEDVNLGLQCMTTIASLGHNIVEVLVQLLQLFTRSMNFISCGKMGNE